MSFLYDRTATINRPTESYPTTGQATNAYAAVYTGVACSIQMKRPMGPPLTTDDSPMVTWEILIDPAFAGTLIQNDQLTDDLGRSFRVKAAYPTPLGWQLLAEDWDATK
jgi:hypothetical protein